eukprot:14466428-Alexandrium_andersonii.AAC.1
MSASLVGSEMCIRDSRWTLRSASSRRPSLSSRPLSSWRSCRGGFVARSCLLYTSDAADDM